jgi:hypothetical protein
MENLRLVATLGIVTKKEPTWAICTQTKITWPATTQQCRNRILLSIPSVFGDLRTNRPTVPVHSGKARLAAVCHRWC